MVSMLLRNAACVALSPPSIESIDLRIQDGTIIERGKRLMPRRNEEVFDLTGKMIIPGFVNAHTHLYSSLARGMPGPKEQPRDFLEILQKIWWKLDRALDDEAIYYSALVGAIDAVRCGTTALIDHHASPNAINGSLDIIKEALSEVGLRGVLCYEVTDRGGKKERDRGLEENERCMRTNQTDSHFRGLVGAHASVTLSNESLRLCGELASSYNTGVHIHVAEDKCDVDDAEENYQSSVTDRLSRYEILKKGSILAHCVHLRQRDFARIQKAECWLVHNPRSNMNNNVGHAPIHLFGNRSALGTDGFVANMLEEARVAFFRHQEKNVRLGRSRNQKTTPMSLLHGGHGMISEYFGKEFRTLTSGSAADLSVIDYQPPTPMHEKNIESHLLFGLHSSMIESVMVQGKWVMRNRNVSGVDVPRVFEKATGVAKKLWKRMETL